MEKDVMKAVMVLLKVQAVTLMLPLHLSTFHRHLFRHRRPFVERWRFLHQT
jgi:hypothetical protein